MNIFIIVGAGLFLLVLYYKPEWVAAFLFTIIIAGINIKVSGAPLNLRALVSLAILGRIFFDKDFYRIVGQFFQGMSSKLFFLFFSFVLVITTFYDLYTIDLLKLVFFVSVSSFCAFYFYVSMNSDRIMMMSLLFAGLICFADLAYTYVFVGHMPVVRVYEYMLDIQIVDSNTGDEFVGSTNHNFFGQICGMCLVYFYCDYLDDRKSGLLKIAILPLMFLSVLMSTSRSALVAAFIVIFLISLSKIKIQYKKKKVVTILLFGVFSIFIALLVFSLFGHYLNLDARFIESITYRLIDEPIAIFKKSFGLHYNIQNLDSGEWRVEASEKAVQAFLHLDFIEQFFGIGYGGFSARQLGAGFNAHNGILLILIEFGIFGFLLYFILIAQIVWKSIKSANISPSLTVLIFILLYGVGQNDELTQSTTFLFVFTVIAELKTIHYNKSPVHFFSSKGLTVI